MILTRSRVGLLKRHFFSFEGSSVSKHADCVLLVVVGVDTLAVLGTGLLWDVLGRRGLGEQHKFLRLSVFLQIQILGSPGHACSPVIVKVGLRVYPF